MKKNYTKPDIAFENFSLSSSIAGNCEFKIDTKGGGECGLAMDGLGVLFLTSMMNVCSTPITDEQSLNYNGFCYHVPMENSTLFNS